MRWETSQVLRTPAADALWVTSWPFAEYVRHDWPGAWVCSIFRNESAARATLQASRRALRGSGPTRGASDLGCVTFVDPSKVRPKRDPGYCFLCAGFEPVGHTRGGLIALQLLPCRMPDAAPALERQGVLL